MEKPSFYTGEKAQLREDFFRGEPSTPSLMNDLFFGLIYNQTPPRARILDIGTGNSFILEQLARRYPGQYGGLLGVDISPSMLEKARARVLGLGVELVLGDNLALPFNSSSFEAVTAKNVTTFSEQEVYRVLKQKGKFFFREYGSGKGLKEIANLFRGRLIRAREPSFYLQRFESAGFKNLSLRELEIMREYSFEEVLQIIQMFPFLEVVTEEERCRVKDYFGKQGKAKITSDQIIIIGEK